MGALASLFGYILNFLYNFFNNYGIAIIMFSLLLRLILLPLTIKQQKNMQKTLKMQDKLKELQFKYKNDQERLTQETMNLYKQENLSPFSGCLSFIIQMLVIVSVFLLVRSPLTYMKKIDKNIIDEYTVKLSEENSKNDAYQEISIIQKYGDIDERLNINMDFLGIDLSMVPSNNLGDFRTYIIPLLYVVSSIISIKISTKSQLNIQDDSTKAENGENVNSELESMQQMNKGMNYMMPILSISIAIVAPLGLALYWLVSNVLMTAERLIIDKVIKVKEA